MYEEGRYRPRLYEGVCQYLAPPHGDWYETRIESALRRREESRRTMYAFVGRTDDCQDSAVKKVVASEKDSTSIGKAKESLVEAFALMAKLEKLRIELGEEPNAGSWDEKRSRIRRDCAADIRQRLERVLEDCERRLPQLEKLLARRERKRAREARRRVRQGAEKARAMERRARRNEEIDAWIREKRESLERERQVENLRKDADVVLADVRAKRNDARKFLGLLQELRNLRRVKVNVARGRGENLPLAADRAFDNIIDQLLEEWSCLEREYSIEEQGLKLMLKADNEEKIEKRKRSTFDEWEVVLFGKKLPPSSPMNLDCFLMTRHAWDKYANFEANGSRVPVGWIIPVPPSSAAWQKCLKRRH